MENESVRQYCLSLAHTTEKVQWSSDLVFKVGGKMYAVLALESRGPWLSFKCTYEDFIAMVEHPGIIPAPYLARAKWIALETREALRPAEIKRLIGQAHELVLAKLPRKAQAALTTMSRGQDPQPRRLKRASSTVGKSLKNK